MILKIAGSSSAGNCYVLQGEKSCLIIEAGIPFSKVKPLIDFNIFNINGVLVSHQHGDHSKYITDYLSYSIPVYTTPETVIAYGYPHNQLKSVIPMKLISIGEFQIMPFELKHDVECFGYLIKHPEMGVMLFATDTYYVPNRFKGLNHIMIEANYSSAILNANVESGKIHPVVKKRVLQSHMSLETVEAMLESNDLTKVKNIILIHLSGNNSDPKMFKERIVGLTGKPVYIAKKGIEITLKNY